MDTKINKNKDEYLIFKQENGYYFGHCLNEDHNNYYLNIGKHQIMVCKKCQIYWWIGKGLFSSYELETEEDWNRNCELIKDFEFIE